jgi:hypothetical protein
LQCTQYTGYSQYCRTSKNPRKGSSANKKDGYRTGCLGNGCIVASYCQLRASHSVQAWRAESVFVNLLRSPGIDSQHVGPVRQPYLSYRPARLHGLAESIHRNRFLASLNITNKGSGLLSSVPCRLQMCYFISSAAGKQQYTERQEGHLAHTLLRMLFTDQKKRVLPQFNDHFCNL